MRAILDLYDHPPTGAAAGRASGRIRSWTTSPPHKHPTVRAWCQANDVELAFQSTYSSWLNWIEAEFAALRYFVLSGTDHRTHSGQGAAIGDYIRRHNQRARPKTGYTTKSKIHHPDYPFKAAWRRAHSPLVSNQ